MKFLSEKLISHLLIVIYDKIKVQQAHQCGLRTCFIFSLASPGKRLNIKLHQIYHRVLEQRVQVGTAGVTV